MFRKFVHFVLLMAILAVGLFNIDPATPSYAAGKNKAVAVDQSMLNIDGTLNMSGLPTGPIDFSGWDVQLDPLKGPVFSPIASQYNWSEVDVMGPINKYIYTFFVDGSDLYVGGEFTNAGGIDEADKIARWDGVNWHALASNGFGNGAIGSGVVYDIVKAGSDFYVAGNFSSVSNTSGIAIGGTYAIAKWNGTSWSSADGDTTSALNSRVSSLAVHSGSPSYLYAAGQFTNVDGISAADYIARLNLTTNTWEALGADSGGDGSIDAWTLSVAVDSAGTVYAGGFFTNADEIAEADYIAKWDSVNEWQALGNTPLNGIVGDVVVDASNNIYAGGNFANAGGILEADYIAKWNGSAWSALSNNGAGNGAVIQVSGGGGGTTVQDMQIVGNELYAVGIIGLANDATADYVIKYDLNSGTWSGFGSNGSGNGSISNSGFLSAVAYTGSTLYIGGYFAHVNNSGTLLDNSQNIAMYTVANSWQSLGGNTAMLQSSNINVMVSTDSDVYIGGSFFDLMGDPSMDNLARWDGTTWHAVGNTGYTSSIGNGSVQDIEVDGNNVYIVGTFTTINNNDVPVAGAARVAKWNGSEWSALGNGIDNNVVEEVEVDSVGNVYIGGSFLNAGGNSAADRVAMWDGASWNSLSSNGASEGAIPNGNVYAMEINGTDLFVGGDFLNVVNTSNSPISNTAGLALWNGSIWSAIPDLTSPLSSAVMAITISGSDLYIGGSFNNLNGLPAADYIAKWNGSAWSALGSGGGGEGSLQSMVHTIVVRGSAVYAGGSFYNVNNGGTDVPAADYIAKFNGANWSSLGSNGVLDGSLNSPVYASMIFKGDLWISGSFNNVNNNGTVLVNADNIAAYGVQTTVSSITRSSTNPTSAASVNFNVTFSEAVQNVDVNDFALTKSSGVSGESVSAVSGSGATYTVTVNTGSGSGTLRLDVPVSSSIQDLSNNALDGLPFTNGESYTKVVSATIKSNAVNDGWILESAEAGNAGGSLNSGSTTVVLGDDGSDREYRAILHFDTSALPDNAVVTNMTLKIKQQGSVMGISPFTFSSLHVDMRNPAFGGSTLELADFNFAAKKVKSAVFNPNPVSGWFSARFNNGGKLYVNRIGTTQLRLYFSTGDNNNSIADFIRFFSGNASSGDRPKLLIQYYVP